MKWFLIFDTETTGLPLRDSAPYTDFSNWPRMVQLAWQVHDETGKMVHARNRIIKPEGFTIPYSAEKIHGISTEKATAEGIPLADALSEFQKDLDQSRLIIGHNIAFDIDIVAVEFLRSGIQNQFTEIPRLCTKESSTEFCAIPGGKGGKFKWPNLSELYRKLFNESFAGAHNAAFDVAATARCFLELVRLQVLTPEALKMSADEYRSFLEKNTSTFALQLTDQKPSAQKEKSETPVETALIEGSKDSHPPSDVQSFTHLHVHTQYSILDGAASISVLLKKAKEDGQTALAITDHGNMFGSKVFHSEARKHQIKPIIGCEVYVARRGRHDKEDRYDGGGDHLILLAKNKQGYHNLVKLVSIGWTEGFYYKPRIDKEVLKLYSEGLIASSACLGGELSSAIMEKGIEEGEKVLLWYKELFGDDYYLELMRHPTGDPEMDEKVYKDQIFVNKVLLELGKKHGVKCIATNDVHFVDKEDADAHDRLICLSTGKDLDDPGRLRYTRQEWLKTRAEMRELFSDIPEALTNTSEIADKVESYDLNRKPILPVFPLPEGFTDEDDYLRHITYEGAARRYKEINDELKERIEFELETIRKMGFPGYFLIVQDFIAAAREMGVAVGPGRGSAAGSVVAYCNGITDIDPIRYQLLFERFLNPDRVSLPDIDIDFDEDGREDVLKWVVEKYGKDKVAHIITFGTMAAKMAIRDVARIQRLPLPEADRLAKMVPERPGVNLKEAYNEVPELKKEKSSKDPLVASTLQYAEILEGSVRHTGLHACGIIIGRDSLIDHVPVCTSKDSELLVTQFDGKHIEDVGMLKMDFLGLKTLSIIKDAVANIFESKGIRVDVTNLPFDDPKTYDLYSRGDTTGLFQFESPGMKKHLRNLKPNRFEDLIAMNALYRPGPMEYIPNYIARKHGKEKIAYELPEMEETLKETYGITVYQEQVMLLSMKLAGFTRGEADSMRKAMGKKNRKIMDEMKEKFIQGSLSKGHPEDRVRKIWTDWESFAEYAFNKSHSTCYAYVSYQTAYLKANYPAEFMAAVLSRNFTDIKKIGQFIEECRRMNIAVLGPDVNESNVRFTVNSRGDIRFGLGAIKGVGESAVQTIIEERKKNGLFRDIYDFVERADKQTINRKVLEGLAYAGAFDGFSHIGREQFFQPCGNDTSFIDSLIRYGNRLSNEKTSNQQTLFGESNGETITRPEPAAAVEWDLMEKIAKEKELLGMYLTAHPLDQFKPEIRSFTNTSLYSLNNELQDFKNREVAFAGIVKSFRQGLQQKSNRPYGNAVLEDYTDSYQLNLWGNDFVNFKNFFEPGVSLLIRGFVEEWESKKDNRKGISLRIKTIHVLTEARKDLVKAVLLSMNLENLNEIFIQNLQSFLVKQDKNAKAKLLRFRIVDNETNIKIDMFSRNQLVDISEEFFNFLESFGEVEYTLFG